MTNFSHIAERIITEQENVMGPLAWEEARKVKGLKVADKKISITGKDQKAAIDALVEQFKRLFGNASVEVCKDAVKSELSQLKGNDIPQSLQ